LAHPTPVQEEGGDHLIDINATYGTKFNMPVVYYSTLMAVAYGRSAKDAALDGQIIPAKKLDELAAK
jgi:heterodisulfide reductase subunit B